MRLFHIPGSRSTRVLWTLEEIGAPYELEILDRAKKSSEEHRARHPLNRVPVLELDDGNFVFESAAICLYLGDLYPDGGVLPAAGTTARAHAFQWSVFAMSEFEPAVFGVLRARRAEQDDTDHVAKLAPLIPVVDAALSNGAYVLGEDFSVPDVLLASMIGTIIRRELAEVTDTMRDYSERTLARPANVRAEAIRSPAADG